MSTEENKALVRRFIEEVHNKGNVDAIDEIYAPDYVNHNPVPPYTPDREGYKRFIAETRAAFPDYRFSIDDLIAEGDKVVNRWTSRSTHRGEFMGMPATGRQTEGPPIDI